VSSGNHCFFWWYVAPLAVIEVQINSDNVITRQILMVCLGINFAHAGLGSTALVLSIAAPFGGSYWYALTLLSPLADGYYWQRGSRVEEVAVRHQVFEL